MNKSITSCTTLFCAPACAVGRESVRARAGAGAPSVLCRLWERPVETKAGLERGAAESGLSRV